MIHQPPSMNLDLAVSPLFSRLHPTSSSCSQSWGFPCLLIFQVLDTLTVFSISLSFFPSNWLIRFFPREWGNFKLSSTVFTSISSCFLKRMFNPFESSFSSLSVSFSLVHAYLLSAFPSKLQFLSPTILDESPFSIELSIAPKILKALIPVDGTESELRTKLWYYWCKTLNSLVFESLISPQMPLSL